MTLFILCILGIAGLEQWFSTAGSFALLAPENPWQCWETFLFVTVGEQGAADIWWVETNDAAVMPRTAPTTKNLPAPNVSCTEVEQPDLEHSFSTCSPQTPSSLSITLELVRNANSGPQPRLSESATLGSETTISPSPD